jgi:NTP-dependent ternary system trypsin peptidase co-occuring protein
MVQLVSFPSDAGFPLKVEVSENDYGVQRVARRDGGIVQATQKLEDALGQAMPTLRSVVRSVQSLAPDEAEIEFGLTLTAEAGAVVAKTAVEGHFTVTLSWTRSGAAKDPGVQQD